MGNYIVNFVTKVRDGKLFEDCTAKDDQVSAADGVKATPEPTRSEASASVDKRSGEEPLDDSTADQSSDVEEESLLNRIIHKILPWTDDANKRLKANEDDDSETEKQSTITNQSNVTSQGSDTKRYSVFELGSGTTQCTMQEGSARPSSGPIQDDVNKQDIVSSLSRSTGHANSIKHGSVTRQDNNIGHGRFTRLDKHVEQCDITKRDDNIKHGGITRQDNSSKHGSFTRQGDNIKHGGVTRQNNNIKHIQVSAPSTEYGLKALLSVAGLHRSISLDESANGRRQERMSSRSDTLPVPRGGTKQRGGTVQDGGNKQDIGQDGQDNNIKHGSITIPNTEYGIKALLSAAGLHGPRSESSEPSVNSRRAERRNSCSDAPPVKLSRSYDGYDPTTKIKEKTLTEHEIRLQEARNKYILGGGSSLNINHISPQRSRDSSPAKPRTEVMSFLTVPGQNEDSSGRPRSARSFGHIDQLRERLTERGENISMLEDRTESLRERSRSLSKSSHQLAEKYKHKKWYE